MTSTFEQRWDKLDRWVRRNSSHVLVARMLGTNEYKAFQKALRAAYAKRDDDSMKAAETARRTLEASWSDD